jgi:hypothetical protein
LERLIAAGFARFPNAQVGVLVVDADKDPICELRLALQPRANAARSDRRVSVVIAASEFEAWIVAGLVGITQPVKGVEALRNPKDWLEKEPERKHSPTVDQVLLTGQINLDTACKRSRSFRKLYKEICALLNAETF